MKKIVCVIPVILLAVSGCSMPMHQADGAHQRSDHMQRCHREGHLHHSARDDHTRACIQAGEGGD